MRDSLPSENDKGYFCGVIQALAILKTHGADTPASEIARAAGHEFLIKMAKWSRVEQDKEMVERYTGKSVGQNGNDHA